MRPVRHRCPNPNCRVVLSIPRHHTWHRVRCSSCGGTVTMPPTLRRPQPQFSAKAS